jgi:hypothetical protein
MELYRSQGNSTHFAQYCIELNTTIPRTGLVLEEVGICKNHFKCLKEVNEHA